MKVKETFLSNGSSNRKNLTMVDNDLVGPWRKRVGVVYMVGHFPPNECEWVGRYVGEFKDTCEIRTFSKTEHKGDPLFVAQDQQLHARICYTMVGRS